jgi:hypothetical protein
MSGKKRFGYGVWEEFENLIYPDSRFTLDVSLIVIHGLLINFP